MYEKSVNSDEFLLVFSGPWNLSHANFFYICMHSWLSFLSVGEKKINFLLYCTNRPASYRFYPRCAGQETAGERKKEFNGLAVRRKGKESLMDFFHSSKTLICCTKSISMANTARVRAHREEIH